MLYASEFLYVDVFVYVGERPALTRGSNAKFGVPHVSVVQLLTAVVANRMVEVQAMVDGGYAYLMR